MCELDFFSRLVFREVRIILQYANHHDLPTTSYRFPTSVAGNRGLDRLRVD